MLVNLNNRVIKRPVIIKYLFRKYVIDYNNNKDYNQIKFVTVLT